MRSLFGALAAVSAIGLAGAAFAADATGMIKSVDMAKNMVTLDNGSTYEMAKSVNLAGLKTGEKVTVTYTQSGKTMDGTAIKPAS